MKLVQTTRGGKTQKYLLRGDSEGFINMWAVPDFSLEEIKQLQNTNATTKGFYPEFIAFGNVHKRRHGEIEAKVNRFTQLNRKRSDSDQKDGQPAIS